MKVDTENCQTIDEQLESIEKEFALTGDFFSFEVHPNIVRADKIRTTRLWRKRRELVSSPECRFDRE